MGDGRWEMGDGWHYREAGGGRSPRNPKGDRIFYKNWSASQWEMGDLSKITPSPSGRWDILTLCPPCSNLVVFSDEPVNSN